MEEAADEMERLRNGAVESRETVQYGGVVPMVTWFDEKIAEECRIAQAEIERLRLTDAEREAIERAADWLYRWQETHGYHSSENGDLATLRSLLERVSFIRDYPEPDNTASEDNESVRKTGGDFGQQPTITDEEREAIRNVLHHISTKADYLQREDYHLRSLLERTKR